MKKLLVVAVMTLLVAGRSYADSDSALQIDDSYAKTKAYMSQQSLTLTGSPSARDDNAAFNQEAILFFGEGAANPDPRLTPAQRELGAKRAAVVIAQRAVAEYLSGFTLVGDTLVKDGVQQYDSIKSAVSGMVRGVQVVVQEYSKEKETAIAIVKLGMHGPRGFASGIYEKMFRDPALKKTVTELDGKPVPPFVPKAEPAAEPKDEAKAEPKEEQPKVAAPPENFDGLIIDATEYNFKPALINRVFSEKKELLYDPSRVSQKVLVEQGCGEYTNSVEKAKSALEARGVKSPLILKATGTVTAADLQVSDGDAVKIFSANQKDDFLAAAKVAFVVK